MAKGKVDKSLCIACGNCFTSCPDCFEMGDDGKAQGKATCKDDCCDLQEIADECPVQAITIE